ncbi:class I adenylate-forming enzyme family protein [Micromonospora inyonensis]|uniref:Crotonobetaine/carnitine-CoA ligase n=1 Tax=Micromonospora inyonensis TaxID=47866 RepID=A0A1C6RJ32_9ACTN|nr:AMP-binding protein [Micromonospora inyonensis]SCL17025.1 crotonobetaine/carnitine-CoA ligase [Micromonospora inyonensis]
MILTDYRAGHDLWQHRVAQTPDRVFLHHEGRRWTYADFDETKRKVAAGLAELGVGVGSPVLVGLSNRPEALFVHFALMQLGAIAIPLQSDLRFEELRHQINHSMAELLIADGALARTVLPELHHCPAVKQVVADVAGERHGLAVSELACLLRHDPLPGGPPEAYTEDSPALVLYTSGSSGRPKGVVLRAGSFASVGSGFAERFGITASDNFFLPLTMAHAIGALVAPAVAVTTGAAITVVDRFSPSTFWRQVAEAGGTCSILFPAHLNLLLGAEADAPAPGESPLRLVITHAWSERFAQRFGVELATVWGMTETGAMATGSEPGAARHRPAGFVGHPMSEVDVGVFDDHGTRLGTGEIGEIRLRHRHVMLGYLRDPAATEQVLVDGWVCSGDEGAVDDSGSVYFLGRTRSMIKRSGENISPDEVVDALMSHAAVVEAFAFGVPDEVRTEEVAALVVVRHPVSPAEILGTAADRIVARKLPRFMVITESALPRLGNGKLDRVAIVEGFNLDTAWDRLSSVSCSSS